MEVRDGDGCEAGEDERRGAVDRGSAGRRKPAKHGELVPDK